MRSTTGCRRCCAPPGPAKLAQKVEQGGLGQPVLDGSPRPHRSAQARAITMLSAKEGMDWMYAWKAVHPQFNTVDEQEY